MKIEKIKQATVEAISDKQSLDENTRSYLVNLSERNDTSQCRWLTQALFVFRAVLALGIT